jgi:hypothetical protein
MPDKHKKSDNSPRLEPVLTRVIGGSFDEPRAQRG